MRVRILLADHSEADFYDMLKPARSGFQSSVAVMSGV